MNWPVQPEWLLVAAIYGFFAKDWIWLLRRDELALLGSGFGSSPGRWQLGFGAHRILLAGREPWAVPLWRLHQPVWRMSWSLFAAPQPCAAPAQAALEEQLQHLRPVGLWAWPLAAVLLVALPLAVLQNWGTLWVLAFAALMYTLLLGAVATAWWQRKALGISVKQMALLSFECLACPLYGIHLVRRLSLALPPPASAGTALALFKQLLAEPATTLSKQPSNSQAWPSAAEQLRLRLHSELAAHAEESPEAARLKATLSWLDSPTATAANTGSSTP